MIPLARAKAIAEKVAESLQPFCHRVEIAGSIRRGRAVVGDIDIVMAAHDRQGAEMRIAQRCKLKKCGEQNIVAIMADETQLDLWFAYVPGAAQPELFASHASSSPKTDNFGILLLARTGSAQFNICLAERSKRFGLHFNPHWGLYRSGICVASATEEEIFAALKLPFIEPADRDARNQRERQRLAFGDFKP